MSRKLEFLLAIIVFIFMTIHFLTDNYIFIQISATIALVNFIVSTVRRVEQHHADVKGGKE